MNQIALALLIFLLTYALMLIFSKYRRYIALLAAAAYVILGILPVDKILSSIDFNVIMMLLGTMAVVSLFIDSGMPNRIADSLLNRMPNVCWAIIALALLAGFISAFVDNVATLLIIAPVGMVISKRLKISPVSVIIAIAVSSNLQGAATLVGDTTSILLGGYAGLDFLDFFVYKGRPGMFWVVEAGAVVTIPVLAVLFHKNRQKLQKVTVSEVKEMFPTAILVMLVVSLILASFIPDKPSITNGLLCVFWGVLGTIREMIRKESLKPAIKVFKELDFDTILLLVGIFTLIGGMENAGVITEIGNLFVRVGGGSMFMMYTLLVFGSVVFSAFIDNIPYVATMLPVVTVIAGEMGVDPTALYFGLLCGATLGGNLTPIGASANITGIGILRRDGHDVSTGDFMRIGVPFTLAAVLVGYVLVWLIWM